MKRIILVVCLSLALPSFADACYRLMTVIIPCDDCGQGQEVQSCVGYYGSGSESCNQLCYLSYCGSGECGGDAYNSCISGSCGGAGLQTALDLPKASLLVPNSQGGYSESAIPEYSCAVRIGINP